MGSGSRFEIYRHLDCFSLGVSINRAPHELSINIGLTFFSIYIGFGKGYDE